MLFMNGTGFYVHFSHIPIRLPAFSCFFFGLLSHPPGSRCYHSIVYIELVFVFSILWARIKLVRVCFAYTFFGLRTYHPFACCVRDQAIYLSIAFACARVCVCEKCYHFFFSSSAPSPRPPLSCGALESRLFFPLAAHKHNLLLFKQYQYYILRIFIITHSTADTFSCAH